MLKFLSGLFRNPKYKSSSSLTRGCFSTLASSPPSPYPFINPQELVFLSNEFLPQDFSMKLERYQDQNPQIYEDIMTTACDIAQEYHYSLRETISENSSSYDFINNEIKHNIDHSNAIKHMTEKGFLRLEYDISRSGMQTPYHISCLARMPFAAANIGLGGAYISQTKAVVRLLDHYPNIQSKENLIADMLHGASYGAVCLAEKHSNISLTDIRCRADFFAKDRSFRIRGTKTCVYGGAHEFGGNTFYIVSARLPKSPEGVDGLSLFIVPKYIRPSLTLEEAFAKGRVFHSPLEANDITIKRVHNIGKSACTYVDLEFGVESTLGAVAFLIGKENEGIKGIRHHLLSNNLQIAYNAISCGMSGYQHALSFASDPQPLDTLRHISYSHYQEIQEEVSPFPDDGHVYVTYKASLPYLEEQEKQRVEDFLNQQQQEAAEAEAEGLAAGYIADGKQVKRPLLARPDIKSLLLTQKAYLEGGLSLCVYATHLLDIVENDHNSEYVYAEVFQLFEFLSPIVKYYCTTFSLQSLHNAKQIFDGIGVVEGNVPQDILRDCEILCQDGFNNTLHSFDLLNHRLTANHGRGYVLLQKAIHQTLQEATKESKEEFQSYVTIISQTLESHIDITQMLLSQKTHSDSSGRDSVALLANSKEYMDLTGHLVVSWMWLRQGVVAYRKLQHDSEEEGRSGSERLSAAEINFYYGKMVTLDFYCHHELIKAKGLIEFLKLNPQMNNSFSPSWF